ncbi:hypothetical protein [Mucilaginibacter sp.]|uniref:hypothetical protein n=1 Tax=Mucilaginibacter sp. TaxID=1882438 RepID=UPI0032634E43
MKKLSRYSNFDDLKASATANKQVNVDEVKLAELKVFFKILRNNSTPIKTETPAQSGVHACL